MLEAWMIVEILKKEREERERQHQPVLELPLYEDTRAPEESPKEESTTFILEF